MANDPEILRRQVIDRLMAQPGLSWTCSSERLVMRARGRTLCKIGRDDSHVLVEFPLARPWASEADGAPFVGPAPPSEIPPESWRQARMDAPEQIDQLLGWLLQK